MTRVRHGGRRSGVAVALSGGIVALALAGGADARPTDRSGPADEPKYAGVREQRPVCTKVKRGQLCVHWVKGGEHAATKAQVKATAKAFKTSWAVEVGQLGFRAPLKDREGPNGGALDVYLADVGTDGQTLASCTPAKPANKPSARAAMAAYCIVDNDFAGLEGEALGPGQALLATAAHELFHAVQFAYDASGEERMLTEGTAAWMEDMVFDDVNQAYGFLDQSPLANPDLPLTYDGPDAPGAPYGAWIFWRFLSESQADGPKLIRDVWELAAAGAKTDSLDPATLIGGPERFAEFGAWNYRLGAGGYEEGAAYLASLLGARPPLDASFDLSAAYPSTGPRSITLDSYTTSYIRLRNSGSTQCTFNVSTDGYAGLILQSGADPGATFSDRVAVAGQGSIVVGAGAQAVLELSNVSAPVTDTYEVTAAC